MATPKQDGTQNLEIPGKEPSHTWSMFTYWLRPHSPLPTATGAREVQARPRGSRAFLAAAPQPAAHSHGPLPQGAGNFSPTAWLRSVSPSPASPASPASQPAQPSPFCAISPATAFAAICSRMQPWRWLRARYTGVQPPRLQLCSPTHGKQCSLCSQPASLCGYRVAERADVHQNRHCDSRNGDIALQLRRITDMAL